MQSLPLAPQSIALGYATYSFAIPTAYSHEPRRPPLPVTSPVPPSMDPGLDEALRRDSQRIADMRCRASSPTAALQPSDTSSLPKPQGYPQMTNFSLPSGRQGLSESNLAKDKAALGSSRAVGPRSRYSTSSTDSKARPTSATSCASVHAPTSVRTSPSPHKVRSGTGKPQDEVLLPRSDAGRSRPDTEGRLATASSARSTLSSSAGRPPTDCSGPSRVQNHASGKALCPVHGTLPPGSSQFRQSPAEPVLSGTASKQDTVDGHVAARGPSLPYVQPAAVDLTIPKDMPPIVKTMERASEGKSGKLAKPGPKQRAQSFREDPHAAKVQVATSASTSKAAIAVANDVQHDYAVLQAMHAAEVTHLHPGTSYFTPKNGCEAVFMPRPSLNHSHIESGGTTGCIAFPRERRGTMNLAQGGEKEFRRDQTSVGPRKTFERNRRLTHSGSMHKAAITEASNSEPLPSRAHRPSLRSSTSLLDLSKVAPEVPGKTLQELLPKPPPSRKVTLREGAAGASPSAAVSMGRTKSESNLRRFVEAPSDHKHKPSVPVRNFARVNFTVEQADDWTTPSDPTEVLRCGRELEAERLKWRHAERSIEGRELAACAPFVRTRCRSKPRSREAVLEAGPHHHSHFSIRRSNKETLQHDSVLPPRSREARGHSHNPADVQGITSAKRMRVRNKTEPTGGPPPGHKAILLVADKATATTKGPQRSPGAPIAGVPMSDDFDHDYAKSSSQLSTALRHVPALPQRPSVLRQLSIPRKAPPARPPPTASDAFDLAAAGEYPKRVSARFSMRVGGDGSQTSLSRGSKDSASEELVVIGRPSECADVEVLDSAAATADRWHTQSLGSHDGGESMLALEAETMLLQQGTAVSQCLTVDEVSIAGGSLATARMGSSSSRRTIVPSPPPRPLPDEPLPSIPGRLSSGPQDDASFSSERRADRTDGGRKTSGEVLLRFRASRSIGRPESLLESPYDSPIGSAESSPPQALSPVRNE